MNKQNDPRYPYTHAADLIRHLGGRNNLAVKLSRLEASMIWHKIAEILGVDDVTAAEKLADYYIKYMDVIVVEAINEITDQSISSLIENAKVRRGEI